MPGEERPEEELQHDGAGGRGRGRAEPVAVAPCNRDEQDEERPDRAVLERLARAGEQEREREAAPVADAEDEQPAQQGGDPEQRPDGRRLAGGQGRQRSDRERERRRVDVVAYGPAEELPGRVRRPPVEHRFARAEEDAEVAGDDPAARPQTTGSSVTRAAAFAAPTASTAASATAARMAHGRRARSCTR